MEEELKEEFIRSLMRFRKVYIMIDPKMELHMGEIMTLKRISKAHSTGFENLSASELHKGAHVSRPAVSQTLNSLEKKGYIVREIDKSDRRKISVSITQKGIELMKNLKEQMDNTLNQLSNRLGYEKMMQAIELLNDITDTVEEVNKNFNENATVRR